MIGTVRRFSVKWMIVVVVETVLRDLSDWYPFIGSFYQRWL